MHHIAFLLVYIAFKTVVSDIDTLRELDLNLRQVSMYTSNLFLSSTLYAERNIRLIFLCVTCSKNRNTNGIRLMMLNSLVTVTSGCVERKMNTLCEYFYNKNAPYEF